MARAVWKGAISFGLVHVPVELVPAAARNELKFSMLDRRDLAPVGYKRVNKKSGHEVPWDDIVKGYEYEDDRYVVLSDEDFRLANVEATQRIDIFGFAAVAEIPVHFFETPYVLVPGQRGEKGYALLREALRRTGRVALAHMVIRNRQHVCTVMPHHDHLLVITLRFASELAPVDQHAIPPLAKKDAYSSRELEMAERLIKEMDTTFAPAEYTDQYRDDLMRRIDAKIAAGETEVLTAPDRGATGTERAGSNVVDLMTLLKKSLDQGKLRSSGGARRATVSPIGAGANAKRSMPRGPAAKRSVTPSTTRRAVKSINSATGAPTSARGGARRAAR